MLFWLSWRKSNPLKSCKPWDQQLGSDVQLKVSHIRGVSMKHQFIQRKPEQTEEKWAARSSAFLTTTGSISPAHLSEVTWDYGNLKKSDCLLQRSRLSLVFWGGRRWWMIPPDHRLATASPLRWDELRSMAEFSSCSFPTRFPLICCFLMLWIRVSCPGCSGALEQLFMHLSPLSSGTYLFHTLIFLSGPEFLSLIPTCDLSPDLSKWIFPSNLNSLWTSSMLTIFRVLRTTLLREFLCNSHCTFWFLLYL